MRVLYGCAFALLVVASFVRPAMAGGSEPVTIECPSDDHAQALIDQSQGIATRPSKHELVLHVGRNAIHLKEEPPYDQAGSESYTYCGKVLDYVLVSHYGDSQWLGSLYRLDSGKEQPAGYKVLFSPDRRYYLAFTEGDGVAAEILTLYTIDGKKLWEGESLIDHYDDTSTVFDNIHWNEADVIEASIKCARKMRGTVKLVQQGDTWNWAPLPPGCKLQDPEQ
ncbi:hypothetical protein [Dyella sp.]|uniref:hypothetical protein n=1 Tax=Dyella sp. TaxID=1869338 RepID=UPI002ED57F23